MTSPASVEQMFDNPITEGVLCDEVRKKNIENHTLYVMCQVKLLDSVLHTMSCSIENYIA